LTLSVTALFPAVVPVPLAGAGGGCGSARAATAGPAVHISAAHAGEAGIVIRIRRRIERAVGSQADRAQRISAGAGVGVVRISAKSAEPAAGDEEKVEVVLCQGETRRAAAGDSRDAAVASAGVSADCELLERQIIGG
jgi:hypothetical protein